MAENFFIFNDEIQTASGYSQRHLRRLEKAGRFPKRRHLSANRVAWVREEIEEWQCQIAEGE